MFGLNGSAPVVNIAGFKSKGDALRFAIDFFTNYEGCGNKGVNYDGADELYKFICERVDLPEVDNQFESLYKCVKDGFETKKTPETVSEK